MSETSRGNKYSFGLVNCANAAHDSLLLCSARRSLFDVRKGVEGDRRGIFSVKHTPAAERLLRGGGVAGRRARTARMRTATADWQAMDS